MFHANQVAGYPGNEGVAMIYALVLMGLLPVVLLPDLLSDDDAGDEAEEPMDNGERTTALIDPPDDADTDDANTDEADADAPVRSDDPSGQPYVAEAGPGDDTTEPDDPDDLEDIALLPVIEDDLPQMPTDTPEEALEPVIEDDEAQAGRDPEDGIDPNPGDDSDQPVVVETSLAPAHTAPAEEDEEWVFASDLADGQPAEISGFEVGKDVLRIQIDPDHELSDLTVSVKESEDGVDSEVSVGGQLLAILRDAPGVLPSDIALEIRRFH